MAASLWRATRSSTAAGTGWTPAGSGSAAVGQQLDGQGLGGEGQVHDLGRVRLGAGLADQAALGQHHHPTSAGEVVGHRPGADLGGGGGHPAQPGHVHLQVEVAGVGHDGAGPIASRCSTVSASRLPVTVTNTSPTRAASATGSTW